MTAGYLSAGSLICSVVRHRRRGILAAWAVRPGARGDRASPRSLPGTCMNPGGGRGPTRPLPLPSPAKTHVHPDSPRRSDSARMPRRILRADKDTHHPAQTLAPASPPSRRPCLASAPGRHTGRRPHGRTRLADPPRPPDHVPQSPRALNYRKPTRIGTLYITRPRASGAAARRAAAPRPHACSPGPFRRAGPPLARAGLDMSPACYDVMRRIITPVAGARWRGWGTGRVRRLALA